VEENKIMRKTASREIRRPYQSVNPYDGKTLKTFEETDRRAARDGASNRRDLLRDLAAHDIRRTGGRDRKSRCHHARARGRVRSPGDVLPKMARKLMTRLGVEVELSAAIIDYYAQNAERFLAPPTPPARARAKPQVERQPVRRALWRSAVELSLLSARAIFAVPQPGMAR